MNQTKEKKKERIEEENNMIKGQKMKYMEDKWH